MAHLIDKEKIKAEIERLYNQSLADENRQADRGLEHAANVSYGKSKACKQLLSFIDSLLEEPVSEDLEEAANNAVIALVPSFGQKNSDGSYVSCYRDCFKRQEFLELYKAGAKWQKEQMMAKAVDVTIAIPYQNGDSGYTQLVYSKEALPFGEKVKVLVIKEG